MTRNAAVQVPALLAIAVLAACGGSSAPDAEPNRKIPPEIRAAIVDESYENGLIPVAHINEEVDGVQLLEVGLNEFMHSTVRTFGPGGGVPMEDPAPSQAFLDLCLEKDCA